METATSLRCGCGCCPRRPRCCRPRRARSGRPPGNLGGSRPGGWLRRPHHHSPCRPPALLHRRPQSAPCWRPSSELTPAPEVGVLGSAPEQQRRLEGPRCLRCRRAAAGALNGCARCARSWRAAALPVGIRCRSPAISSESGNKEEVRHPCRSRRGRAPTGGPPLEGTAGAEAGTAGTAAAAATASRRDPDPRSCGRPAPHRCPQGLSADRRAQRVEGRVLVEMHLEGDGPGRRRLLEGSGYAVLDDATIVAVRRASPFPPVARVLTVPVEYRLVTVMAAEKGPSAAKRFCYTSRSCFALSAARLALASAVARVFRPLSDDQDPCRLRGRGAAAERRFLVSLLLSEKRQLTASAVDFAGSFAELLRKSVHDDMLNNRREHVQRTISSITGSESLRTGDLRPARRRGFLLEPRRYRPRRRP